jgi:hypothetical protein
MRKSSRKRSLKVEEKALEPYHKKPRMSTYHKKPRMSTFTYSKSDAPIPSNLEVVKYRDICWLVSFAENAVPM